MQRYLPLINSACQGPLRPKVVNSTDHTNSHQANNILCFGKVDAHPNNKPNYWLAKKGKTEDQGFIMKVDNCSRSVAGFWIKNKGRGAMNNWATKDFLVSGKNKTGSWQNLTKARLNDTRNKAAPLLNFTFDKPYLLQFLKFDLISYWGDQGGGLQYFAPIPATGKHKHDNIQRIFSQIHICIKRSQM